MAAALTLAASVLVCAHSATARSLADGGGGTYLVSGRDYDFVLFNAGSTPWRNFYLVAPRGMSFVGGTTGNEGSASCVVGQPAESSNEIQCGPLSPGVMPPQARVAFVATMSSEGVCGPSFQLFVNSADGAPFTRV